MTQAEDKDPMSKAGMYIKKDGCIQTQTELCKKMGPISKEIERYKKLSKELGYYIKPSSKEKNRFFKKSA